MIYLCIYLGVGVLLWARNRFSMELLQKHTWTALRVGGYDHVEHTQERQWVEWVVTGLFFLAGWPILLALMTLMFVHAATGWLLERIAG
jgi:hypothetical protein